MLNPVHPNTANPTEQPVPQRQTAVTPMARRLHTSATPHRIGGGRNPTVINIGPLVMKTLKLTLLLLGTLAAAAPLAYSADYPKGSGAAVKVPASKAHVLSREELDKLLAQPGKVLVIDVRRPDEVSEIGGLPVYLSIQAGDLEKNLAWIPKDRLIVTLSNHAGRCAGVFAS